MIDNSSEAHLWNATVDAATGELLAADDWTSHENHEDLEATLSRGTARSAAFTTPFPVNDGSSYRVFEFPDESANDAPRALVRNPADGLASPFGWHDTNGANGAELTTTQGNNVHAYLDQDADNAPDFGATDGGPGLDFDFGIEEGEHAQNHRDAAVANLFYANNMIHDILYRYGFDEPSGELPGRQLRPRRRRGRLRAGRGGRRQRHQQRQLLDPGGRLRHAADADVPVAGQPVRPSEPGGRGRRRHVRGDLGAVRPRAPTDAGLPGRTLVYGGNGCRESRYPRTLPARCIAVVDGGTKHCGYVTRAEVAEGLGADMCIRTYHDGFHGFPDVMLFDLGRDPDEQYDLAGDRGDLVAHAMGLLEEWQAAAGSADPLRTMLDEGGPWHVRGQLDGYLARLRGTGRSAWAETLERRHAWKP